MTIAELVNRLNKCALAFGPECQVVMQDREHVIGRARSISEVSWVHEYTVNADGGPSTEVKILLKWS